jgi:dihydrofolate reductase
MKPHPTFLAIIVARARNGVIGRDGQLPWRYPEDLRWFKQHTTGHAVVMGRKTFTSIGRPLPNRTNVVVSRSLREGEAAGCSVVTSLEAALEAVANQRTFVIGGAALYREALPLVTHIYVTEIDRDFEGDTWFPPFDEALFEERSSAPGDTPELRFRILERRHER